MKVHICLGELGWVWLRFATSVPYTKVGFVCDIMYDTKLLMELGKGMSFRALKRLLGLNAQHVIVSFFQCLWMCQIVAILLVN